MISVDLVWKNLFLLFDPLPEGSKNPGVPKGVVAAKILAQPDVPQNEKSNPVNLHITLIFINKALPALFSDDTISSKIFCDDAKGTFLLQSCNNERIQEKKGKIPPITEVFRATLREELRKEIVGRKSTNLVKRTRTEPNLQAHAPPAKRQKIDSSQTVVIPDNDTPIKASSQPEPQVPIINNNTVQKSQSTVVPKNNDKTNNNDALVKSLQNEVKVLREQVKSLQNIITELRKEKRNDEKDNAVIQESPTKIDNNRAITPKRTPLSKTVSFPARSPSVNRNQKVTLPTIPVIKRSSSISKITAAVKFVNEKSADKSNDTTESDEDNGTTVQKTPTPPLQEPSDDSIGKNTLRQSRTMPSLV